MAGIERVTAPTLDVLEALLRAYQAGEKLHGWAIMKQVQRSGPTVYRVLDRLEDTNWIKGEWEDARDDLTRPRRRLYELTGVGVPAARALLSARRPAALKPRPTLGFLKLNWIQALFAGGGR